MARSGTGAASRPSVALCRARQAVQSGANRLCRPRSAMKLGAACFGKTEVVGHDWLKGACRGESPSAALFFQSFSGGRKALASPEVKAEKIDIFQELAEFLPCGKQKLNVNYFYSEVI